MTTKQHNTPGQYPVLSTLAGPAEDNELLGRGWCLERDGSFRSNGPTPKEVDPNGIDAHTPGAKLDAGKPLSWLCISGFANALAEVATVTTRGAAKYTPNGWVKVDDGAARYMEAFGRHMMALGRGETLDPDTGCQHKAQMIWNLLASFELELRAPAKPV